MTILEIILLIAIVALIAFFLYYFFRGSSGPVSISRPVESRVDMYLDRRFDLLMEEYSLITKPKLKKYRAEKEPALLEEEGKIEGLKRFKEEMAATLSDMEKRLDVLEKEFEAD